MRLLIRAGANIEHIPLSLSLKENLTSKKRQNFLKKFDSKNDDSDYVDELNIINNIDKNLSNNQNQLADDQVFFYM